MKKIVEPDDQSIDELLKAPNMIIFFYMDGCPHCDQVRPFWDELTRSLQPDEVAEVESAAVSSKLRKKKNIEGFPHFVIRKDGVERASPGSKATKAELAKSLGISTTGGFRRFTRRRARRLRRRIRKTLK